MTNTATETQGETSTGTLLQVLQGQESAIAKQLAASEMQLKNYEQELKGMSASERDLNAMVRSQRQANVASLRAQLDGVRQEIQNVRAGVGPSRQVIARVEDAPLIVTDAPATVGYVEPAHFFGMEPRQFREPALFLLVLPLVLALSRWIWRRTPVRPNRDSSTETNPQISRLEQAVESIAIEVERIGEAQRFSAKLMAEGRPEKVREVVRRVATPIP